MTACSTARGELAPPPNRALLSVTVTGRGAKEAGGVEGGAVRTYVEYARVGGATWGASANGAPGTGVGGAAGVGVGGAAGAEAGGARPAGPPRQPLLHPPPTPAYPEATGPEGAGGGAGRRRVAPQDHRFPEPNSHAPIHLAYFRSEFCSFVRLRVQSDLQRLQMTQKQADPPGAPIVTLKAKKAAALFRISRSYASRWLRRRSLAFSALSRSRLSLATPWRSSRSISACRRQLRTASASSPDRW